MNSLGTPEQDLGPIGRATEIDIGLGPRDKNATNRALANSVADQLEPVLQRIILQQLGV